MATLAACSIACQSLSLSYQSAHTKAATHRMLDSKIRRLAAVIFVEVIQPPAQPSAAAPVMSLFCFVLQLCFASPTSCKLGSLNACFHWPFPSSKRWKYPSSFENGKCLPSCDHLLTLVALFGKLSGIYTLVSCITITPTPRQRFSSAFIDWLASRLADWLRNTWLNLHLCRAANNLLFLLLV